jgi:hypothetical protein
LAWKWTRKWQRRLRFLGQHGLSQKSKLFLD